MLSSWSPSSMLWWPSWGLVGRGSLLIIRTGKLLKLSLSSFLSWALHTSSLFLVSYFRLLCPWDNHNQIVSRPNRLKLYFLLLLCSYQSCSSVHPRVHHHSSILLHQHWGEKHPSAPLEEMEDQKVADMTDVKITGEEIFPILQECWTQLLQGTLNP